MIDSKHIPQYVRYFYYPAMWEHKTIPGGSNTRETYDSPNKKGHIYNEINRLIMNLTETQRRKLFYWIYFNYKQEVTSLIEKIKQNQKQD